MVLTLLAPALCTFAPPARPFRSTPGLALPRGPRHIVMQAAPLFALILNTPAPFVYETSYGGAEQAPLGVSAFRFATLAQALALGRKLEAASPTAATYSVFKLADGEMTLKGRYPKRVNAEGAKVRFRKRRPRTGGADDSLLGVGGMGDDIWRELMERAEWSSIDEAWSSFRKELELGRDIEIVDERGEPLDFGGDPDDDDPEYD